MLFTLGRAFRELDAPAVAPLYTADAHWLIASDMYMEARDEHTLPHGSTVHD